MVEIRNQNLLTVDADVICHQVNCQGVMGSGVAKAIADRWPVVKIVYQVTCKKFKPEELLGKILPVYVSRKLRVVNIFGQLTYGRDKTKVYTDYAALKRAFTEIAEVYKGRTIAFPYKFGCGLANGDWNVVYNLIEDYFKNCNVIICKI